MKIYISEKLKNDLNIHPGKFITHDVILDMAYEACFICVYMQSVHAHMPRNLNKCEIKQLFPFFHI